MNQRSPKYSPPAGGLEVASPREMQGMRTFHRDHPEAPLKEILYQALPENAPRIPLKPSCEAPFPFTCESAPLRKWSDVLNLAKVNELRLIQI